MRESCATGIIPVNHTPARPFRQMPGAPHHLRMDQKLSLGAAISALRKERRLTQDARQFADAGVEQGTLSKIERGKVGMSFDTLGVVAKALGVLPSEILARAEVIAGQRHVKEPAPAYARKADAGIQLQNDVDALRYVLGGLVGAIARHEQRIAADAAIGARASAPESFQNYGVMKELLGMLEQHQGDRAEAPVLKPRARRAP